MRWLTVETCFWKAAISYWGKELGYDRSLKHMHTLFLPPWLFFFLLFSQTFCTSHLTSGIPLYIYFRSSHAGRMSFEPMPHRCIQVAFEPINSPYPSIWSYTFRFLLPVSSTLSRPRDSYYSSFKDDCVIIITLDIILNNIPSICIWDTAVVLSFFFPGEKDWRWKLSKKKYFYFRWQSEV